jgi:DNA invertase Pin-like site-specific DNA recombinase
MVNTSDSGAAGPGVSRDDRAILERWVRSGTTPQRTVIRSRIVLLLDEGLSAREVARRLGVSRHTVDLWRARYIKEGCDVLTHDRPGRGRKRASADRTS